MPHARVGDVDLYYEITDCTEPWKAGPPPVVFVHGLGGDHRVWLYQVPAFCNRFPTITVDLRGHGASSKPDRDLGMADMALDVVRLLRAFGVERAHLIGLSLGGMVVQQLALDFPLAVASLVLADTLCGMPPGFENVMQDALRFIEQNSMPDVAKARITNAFSEAVNPMMRDYLIDRVARNDKAAYVRAARAAFGFSVCGRLGEIAAPTLVVVGDADRVTPPPLSEEIAARIPRARLARIANAGHITNMERPQEFNRVVLDFLSSLER
ncbi:MAG: alpha/beta fold hydrolase [Candidatus Binatia bacterium]